MNNIKFRAWDKETGEMLPVLAIDFKEKRLVTRPTYPYVWNNYKDFENVILMQYSGVKDKNGRDIYEGDVIQYKHYYATKRWWKNLEEIPEIEREVEEQKQQPYILFGVVKFGYGEFALDYPLTCEKISRGYYEKSGNNSTNSYEERYWDFEVVGNIYENPELLDEK